MSRLFSTIYSTENPLNLQLEIKVGFDLQMANIENLINLKRLEILLTGGYTLNA